MRRTVNLALPYAALDVILADLYDGLEVWKNTEEYLDSGCVVAPCVIAECSSVREARGMRKLYEKTISLIEKKAGKNHCKKH
jgi:hypothetical protein